MLLFFTWQIYLAEGTQVNHERQAGWRVNVTLFLPGRSIWLRGRRSTMRVRQAGGSRLPFCTWQIYLAEGTQVNHERQAGWRVNVTLFYLADLSG